MDTGTFTAEHLLGSVPPITLRGDGHGHGMLSASLLGTYAGRPFGRPQTVGVGSRRLA